MTAVKTPSGTIPKCKASRFRGVTRARNHWRADVYLKYRKHCVGVFANEEDAARAYDAKARSLDIPTHRLNFPELNLCELDTRTKATTERARFTQEIISGVAHPINLLSGGKPFCVSCRRRMHKAATGRSGFERLTFRCPTCKSATRYRYPKGWSVPGVFKHPPCAQCDRRLFLVRVTYRGTVYAYYVCRPCRLYTKHSTTYIPYTPTRQLNSLQALATELNDEPTLQMLEAIKAHVPDYTPQDIRDDLYQYCFLAMLTGELSEPLSREKVKPYIRQAFEMRGSWRTVSLEQPMFDGKRLIDFIPG